MVLTLHNPALGQNKILSVMAKNYCTREMSFVKSDFTIMRRWAMFQDMVAALKVNMYGE